MTYMVLFFVSLIILLVGLVLCFVWINDASPKLVEILIPVIGALLLSSLWIFQKASTDSEKNFSESSAVINFEYISGGQLPIFSNINATKPFQLNHYKLWSAYIFFWNNQFLDKRDASKVEDFFKNDQVHFRFFEFFIMKSLSEQFALGWNYNPVRVYEAPYGNFGISNYGIEEKFMTKIFLKDLINFKQFPNEFMTSDSDKFYQIAVPRGSKVKVIRNENSMAININNERFDFTISFEHSGAMFDARAFRDDVTYPFYLNLMRKFRSFGRLQNPEDLRMRTFKLNCDFKQKALFKFSKQADLDAQFAKNIWDYFDKNMTWRHLKDFYQEISYN